MKRKLTQIFLAFVLIFSLMGVDTTKAGNIQSIDLDATIHKDGSVTIRDTREFSVYEGTEHYLNFANLGESELLSYAVYDEAGNQLEDIGRWDIDASREEKARKYGVNYTSDGFEICFGFGEYGQHKFTIAYKLSNFIFNLEDGKQAFYWSFLNKGMDPIDQATLTIRDEMNTTFEYPQVKIWGFGYVGQTKIEGQELKTWTTESMYSSNYMVILSIFDSPLYESSNKQDMTSRELIDKALDGASYNEESGDGSSTIEDNNYYRRNDSSRDFFFLIPFIGFAAFFAMLRPLMNNNGIKKLAYKPGKDVNYYREIPHNPFEDTYLLTESRLQDLLSAFVLKWIFEGRIQEQKDESGFVFKKEKVNLQIIDLSPIENNIENELFYMVLSASGKDQVLTEKEFSNYVKRNSSKITSWLNKVEQKSEDFLIDNNYYDLKTEKVLWMKKDKYELNEEGKKLTDNIYGFKKYLEEYSLVSERSTSEVRLWNDYLVWASYLGIAEKVYKEFEVVNPEYVHNDWDIYYTFRMVNAFSRAANRSYSSARQASFSGSGGGTFTGGGGGSFGGGFGGGSR